MSFAALSDFARLTILHRFTVRKQTQRYVMLVAEPVLAFMQNIKTKELSPKSEYAEYLGLMWKPCEDLRESLKQNLKSKRICASRVYSIRKRTMNFLMRERGRTQVRFKCIKDGRFEITSCIDFFNFFFKTTSERYGGCAVQE
jgi:hypothetical protein